MLKRLISFMLAFLLMSCSEPDNSNAESFSPQLKGSIISTHQNIQRYELFLNGLKLTIARSNGDIIISYPRNSSPAEKVITLTQGSADYDDVDKFLTGIFEFKIDMVDPNVIGSVMREKIYDDKNQEIKISDENIKKFALYQKLSSGSILVDELYVNNKRPLEHEVINYYLRLGRD